MPDCRDQACASSGVSREGHSTPSTPRGPLTDRIFCDDRRPQTAEGAAVPLSGREPLPGSARGGVS